MLLMATSWSERPFVLGSSSQAKMKKSVFVCSSASMTPSSGRRHFAFWWSGITLITGPKLEPPSVERRSRRSEKAMSVSPMVCMPGLPCGAGIMGR